MELGGSEVFLERGVVVAPMAQAAPDAPAPAPVSDSVPKAESPAPKLPTWPTFPNPAAESTPEAETPSRPAAEPPIKPSGRKPAEFPKWRKDPPPIPGPGLQIVPPEDALLGDLLAGFTTLDALAGHIAGCRLCRLCEGRKQTVPGEGNPAARLMLIGEGPGATEDETGRPFVGAAGQLLDQILAAIECPRATVFIANIVKCRPPQNRKPLPEEAAACLPYLHRQIALVRPTVILAMGGTAAEAMLGVKGSLGEFRTRVHRYGTTPLIVTYHPAALLRNPNWKKPTWDDVRIARQLLEP